MTRIFFTWIVAALSIVGLVGFICYFQGRKAPFKEDMEPVPQIPHYVEAVPDVVETASSLAAPNDENPPDYEYDEEVRKVIEKAESEARKRDLEILKIMEKDEDGVGKARGKAMIEAAKAQLEAWKEMGIGENKTVETILEAWNARERAEMEVTRAQMVIWQTIENINDKEILLKIAKNDKHPKMRLYAAYKLDDRALYVEIAKNDKDEEVRKEAEARLYQLNQLEKQP